MLARGLSLARPALRAGSRTMATELPTEAPIKMFGTSGRYANALYAAAAKKGALLDVEADLKLFKETCAGSAALKAFVIDPSISRTSKAAGISATMDAAKASEATKNMMIALAEGGRMGEVFKVIDMYGEILAAAKGEAKAVITTATEAKPGEIKKIVEMVKAKIGVTELAYEVKVDPAIYTGYTVNLGDKFLDASGATATLKVYKALGLDTATTFKEPSINLPAFYLNTAMKFDTVTAEWKA